MTDFSCTLRLSVNGIFDGVPNSTHSQEALNNTHSYVDMHFKKCVYIYKYIKMKSVSD